MQQSSRQSSECSNCVCSRLLVRWEMRFCHERRSRARKVLGRAQIAQISTLSTGMPSCQLLAKYIIRLTIHRILLPDIVCQLEDFMTAVCTFHLQDGFARHKTRRPDRVKGERHIRNGRGASRMTSQLPNLPTTGFRCHSLHTIS